MKAAITATGRYFPPREVPNSWFCDELGLDTSDAWIQERTGIRTRRLAEPGVACSHLAVEAGRIALARRGLTGADLDAIVVATVTPDQPLPSVACFVQAELQATRAFGFDLVAACSGFVYSLEVVTSMITSGRYQRILLLGADHMSSITDFGDRNTAVLFGDAAGAVLVEAVDDDHPGTIGPAILHSDGTGAEFLQIPAGGGRMPLTPALLDASMHKIKQEGRTVFKHAVTRMQQAVEELLQRCGMALSDVDLFVPHQANIRIVQAAARNLGLDEDRIVVTIDRFANTTSATIPTSLDIAWEEGRLRQGHRVVIATFGAGFTWGAQLITWGIPNP